jgi:hypothetical protein
VPPSCESRRRKVGKRSSTPAPIKEPKHSVVSNGYCAICDGPNLAERGAGCACTGWIKTATGRNRYNHVRCIADELSDDLLRGAEVPLRALEVDLHVLAVDITVVFQALQKTALHLD